MIDKEDLPEAVEANVEDFYGDVDVDDPVGYAVEDAVANCPITLSRKEMDNLYEIARNKYNIMHENDHKEG